MAKSKDDIKYGTAQARLSEDEAVRVAYKHGTPLEGGKVADSEPVDLFSSAHSISKASTHQQDQPADSSTTNQSQQHHEPHMDEGEGGGRESNTRSAKFPNKSPPSLNTKYV
ncbi:SEED MATURATION PROTEIN 1 [Ziziphus jujuba]|uniref:SEED MATURATION PROTEIN 1 n=2 Tax=Ziziphus jujuba TaxID=326968 RepID=A0A6P3ZQU2_ZIZJJ|nr:SEED MATURATION PROTEIN 1 [Ziziphus jujuba]KAH7528090.1 hypothetical protein FEM48_Zijuj05G0035000 [Ziziphus jujuba var. spinosa]